MDELDSRLGTDVPETKRTDPDAVDPDARPTGSDTGESDAGPTGDGATTWVVSNDGAECAHPRRDLRLVGDDGRNSYYQCGACDAVIVSQDELLRAVGSTRGRAE